MKIAIVHDAFMQWGGAENLVLAMSELWPEAQIFTSVVNRNILPPNFPLDRLNTSFIQNLPLSKKLYQPLFFLQPLAFEQMDLSSYDIVISSTTKFAKSIIASPNTLHICYCNTPTRILWFFQNYITQRAFNPISSLLAKYLLPPVISVLRTHDYIAAQKVDYFIANSQNVAQRIQEIYHRQSNVIYPFVDLEKFRTYPSGGPNTAYYLIVSRLSGHKRVDVAINAFNQLGYTLKIIGTGSEEKKFRRLAKANIKLLGRLPDNEVVEYYQSCKALIYPQEEDFGITALEAQATGKPVIAYRAGGALETVIENKTGVFFTPQTPAALIEAVKRFEQMKFNPRHCVNNAKQFSRDRFLKELSSFVYQKHQQSKTKSSRKVDERSKFGYTIPNNND